MESNADLARRQLARHGVDRYPTVARQYMKLVTEVGELGDELLASTRDDARVRAEAADVAISLYHLAAKLHFDLDEAVVDLVAHDERRFDA